MDAADALDKFDGDPAAEESADDGLAAGGEEGAPGDVGNGRLVEDAEDAAAEEGADGRSGDDEPALFVGEDVSGAGAGAAVEGVSGGVPERLKDGMERGMRA
jgi:hypothetical protein